MKQNAFIYSCVLQCRVWVCALIATLTVNLNQFLLFARTTHMHISSTSHRHARIQFNANTIERTDHKKTFGREYRIAFSLSFSPLRRFLSFLSLFFQSMWVYVDILRVWLAIIAIEDVLQWCRFYRCIKSLLF